LRAAAAADAALELGESAAVPFAAPDVLDWTADEVPVVEVPVDVLVKLESVWLIEMSWSSWLRETI
jgi:hypothetical protein